MRMRKKKNGEARFDACSEYVIANREELERYTDRLPCELEIGCGKGGFIIQMAQLHPDTFFIAVELSTDALITALENTKEIGIPNLRFMNINANLLPEIFKKGEVSRIYLNFSDPWPKARHAKRRLTYRTFLEKYRAMLPDDGVIVFKTDNRGLFDFSLEEFEAVGMPVTELTYDLHNSEYNEGNVVTEYEKNFSAKGFTINRAVIHMH